ncbi:hypothetical protein CKAH01_09775 [Colletotrichum kahawae]|uniref:Uncharacterized protein n=1 Tax=Colletotrichum kahawae TaxID=34407 RepID=A0AAD9XZI5_COLKA|nr:hypothetical protein CKAH01_09775 [Colletotrichum kahawae]
MQTFQAAPSTYPPHLPPTPNSHWPKNLLIAAHLRPTPPPSALLYKPLFPPSFLEFSFFFFLHVDNTSENHFYSIRPILGSLQELQIPPWLMSDILDTLE